MTNLTIEKIKIPVTLHMSNSSVINGNIFLSKFSALHQGRELSKDMFNSGEDYFPTELKDDNSIIFINKSNVVKITSLEEKEIIDEEEKMEKVRMPVTLLIIDNSLIE